ncbi:MAG TPA: hypothetical protein VGE85_09230 [Terracidiphilus sp.]
MAEFVIKVADERGRVQEQVQTADTSEDLRSIRMIAGMGRHAGKLRSRSIPGAQR